MKSIVNRTETFTFKQAEIKEALLDYLLKYKKQQPSGQLSIILTPGSDYLGSDSIIYLQFRDNS